ncbi:SAM-dependent methyltransferase, partial [Candidatus Saccharibacteria bacterium 32-49-10]
NRKAAENMAALHNQLRDDNYTGHDLEVLLVRLVFCMFADDAGIFDQHALRDYLVQRTSVDGSDLGPRLMQIFQALNTPAHQRQSSLDEAIASLPYVNGGLFIEPIRTPYFTADMRRQLLQTMDLDWSQVSPAIFGSMFQGVMDAKERRNLGAHYTSEKNILRVIKPLFLDELYEEFARAIKSGPRKKFAELRNLQDKIANLKFLDPACGAGNFLVITYRELRKLEHKIVAHLAKDTDTVDWLSSAGEGAGTLRVNVDQMYGIEIEEFPSLIAQAALWLTDHQMNMEYSRESGRMFKRLPLTHSATIVNDNALTVNWEDIVAPSELDYILGNPPFIGSNIMTATMRDELELNFNNTKNTGLLDFVSAWYAKSTNIMKQNAKIRTALVSTNSITQGEQVGVLWKYLFEQGVIINFAHRTFKWTNDAKGIAAVYCVVIGFSLSETRIKRIFDYPNVKSDPIEVQASNINPYLMDAPSLFVERRSRPLCNVPILTKGNQPTDGGHLILSDEEKAELIASEPLAEKYVKKLIGAREFIQNTSRWCLWLVDCS